MPGVFLPLMASLLAVNPMLGDGSYDKFLLRHEGSGMGSAQLLGNDDTAEGSFFSDGDPLRTSLSFGASDLSEQPGVFGAGISASGISIYGLNDDVISAQIDFSLFYSPSNQIGGDNPGGMSEGEMSIVVEFEIPIDNPMWDYGLLIEETADFSGTTDLLIENITQGAVIADTQEMSFQKGVLDALAGDVLRITTLHQGSGSTGPAGMRGYFSDLSVFIFVPEPSSLMILAGGLVVSTRRK